MSREEYSSQERLIFRVLVGVVSASLAINSFLVTNKIDEINTNINEMTKAITRLEVTVAVGDSRIAMIEKKLVSHDAHFLRIWGDIKALEKIKNKAP